MCTTWSLNTQSAIDTWAYWDWQELSINPLFSRGRKLFGCHPPWLLDPKLRVELIALFVWFSICTHRVQLWCLKGSRLDSIVCCMQDGICCMQDGTLSVHRIRKRAYPRFGGRELGGYDAEIGHSNPLLTNVRCKHNFGRQFWLCSFLVGVIYCGSQMDIMNKPSTSCAHEYERHCWCEMPM